MMPSQAIKKLKLPIEGEEPRHSFDRDLASAFRAYARNTPFPSGITKKEIHDLLLKVSEQQRIDEKLGFELFPIGGFVSVTLKETHFPTSI